MRCAEGKLPVVTSYDDEEIEVIRDGARVIGTLEYSFDLDHWKVWSVHHSGYSPRLMYDHDEAVRWIKEIHVEHLRTADRRSKPDSESRVPRGPSATC